MSPCVFNVHGWLLLSSILIHGKNKIIFYLYSFLDGVWQLDDYENIHLGVDPVRCMLAVNHLMWVANGQCVYSVHVNTLVEGRGVKQVVTQVSNSMHIEVLSRWSHRLVSTHLQRC